MTVTLETFNPKDIPWQLTVVKDIKKKYNFNDGVHEVLLSGAVGSAKTTLLAHLICCHALDNKHAKILIGRRSLPDLKKTLYQKVIDHLNFKGFEQGKDYEFQGTTGNIQFLRTGSEVISASWADKRYMKFRSLELSMAVFEELTENNEDDSTAYKEISMRVGRINHINEKLIISATNPDSPGHWAYKYFIESKSQLRHVYYSKTEDNKFLPPSYIERLKTDLDPKMARRMLHGEWLEIDKDRIYYAYQTERNFKDAAYEINKAYPIALCFDFNIGANKPMSSCAYQFVNGAFHVFDEVIIHGARTADVMDAWFDRGLFTHGCKIIVHGDATGAARNTRSIHSDYDIIKKFVSTITPHYEMQVPRDNPPVRTRHNRVNAYCLNEAGQTRLYVYNKCKTVHDGMRLTALKKGGDYIEDDSKPYQHVTTALGYGIVYDTNRIGMQGSSSERIR